MGGSGLPEVKSIRITRKQLGEMREHIQNCLPAEACGLLAGSERIVHEVFPIKNIAESAARFRMDPVEQLRAFQRIESRGWELVGIFHSHPAGPPRPSETDVAEAAYDVVHIIWSPGHEDWDARAFLIRDGAASAVKLEVADDGQASATAAQNREPRV